MRSPSGVTIVSTVLVLPVARSVKERVVVYVRFPFGISGGSQDTVRVLESIIVRVRLVTGLGTGGERKNV